MNAFLMILLVVSALSLIILGGVTLVILLINKYIRKDQ